MRSIISNVSVASGTLAGRGGTCSCDTKLAAVGGVGTGTGGLGMTGSSDSFGSYRGAYG